MAISSIASYVPTMEGFVDHWTAVNAAVSPSELLLRGGYDLAAFTSDQSDIDSAVTAIESADNARQIASSNRDLKKASARIRIAQYRASVIGILAGTPYVNALPKLPPFSSNPGTFLKAMDDMANGWSRINTDTIAGFTGPLLLAGGYTLANYTTELAAMRTAFTASTNAEDDDRLARSTRDVLLGPAKARMVQYRQAVKGILPAGSALLNTIPSVTPAPGSTPDPVNASGVWNAGATQADLTWTPSTNPHLDHYEIRISPGSTYHTADESVVDSVDSSTLAFSTLEGLVAPGATAVFKVYVVLTTGNEKGSNTIKITRPDV